MLKGLRKRLATIFTAFTGAVLAGVLAVTYYLNAQQTVQEYEMWFSNAVNTVSSTVLTQSVNEEPMSGVYLNGKYIIYVQLNGEADKLMEQDVFVLNDTSVATTVTAEEAQTLFTQARTISEEEGITNWVEESYQIAISGEASVAEEAIPYSTVQGSVRGDVAILSENGSYYGMVQQAQPAQPVDDVSDIQSVSILMGPVVGMDGVFEMDSGGVDYRATYYTWTMWDPDNTEAAYEVAILEDLSGQNSQLLLTGLLYGGILVAGLFLLYLANWFLARLVLRPTEEGVRRQTEFVAAASHELRSPLAVIRSSLSAADAAKDDEEAGRFKEAAAQEAERMTHLVDDLLLLAGGDAGGWNLVEAPVDMDTLLIDAAEVYRPLAREKGVGLELELPEETLPTVNGDAERLRQILAVLMDNALQYAPEGTDITLAAKLKKGKLRISVADRGHGIPDDEKEKVFERFYKADESRHDKEHFGLGLSVARELAELHGGSLSAADTKDGGATFTLKLPV